MGPSLSSSGSLDLARRMDLRLAIEAFALASIAIALAASCLIPDACGLFHDDGIYVLTAKSLAEGNGYRLINLPGSPIQTKYPIGYPALLALCWWAWPSFPGNLIAMHVLTLVLAGAAVGMTYLYLVRFNYTSKFAAASGCLLCATCYEFAYFSGRLLTEMPFALLLVVALWAFDGLVRSPEVSRRRAILAGLAMAAPLLFRSAGVAPIAVFGVAALRRRSLIWTILGMSAIVLPWLAWTSLNRGEAVRNPIVGYYTDYLGWWTSAAPRSTAQFLALNAFYLVICIPNLIVDDLAFAGLPTSMGLFFRCLVGLIALAGVLGSRGVLRLAIAAYLALVWIWPWPPFRFEVPIAPILAALGLDLSMKTLGRFAPSRTTIIVGAIFVAPAVAANLGSLDRHRQFASLVGYPSLWSDAQPGSWPRFERLFGWIRDRTGPDDVLASNLDPLFFLYTGRPSFRPFPGHPLELFYGQEGPGAGTVEELKQALSTYGAQYLIRVPTDGITEVEAFDRLIAETTRLDPDLLKMVYSDGEGQFLVYQIQPKPQPETSPRLR